MYYISLYKNNLKKDNNNIIEKTTNNSTYIIFRLGTIFALNLYIRVSILDIQLIRQPLFQDNFLPDFVFSILHDFSGFFYY